jgi:hypothetical protein
LISANTHIEVAFSMAKARTDLKLIGEFLIYGLPTSITILLTHLAFWPAQINYDASVQWMEAMRGHSYTDALVVPVTLFMRLVGSIWSSPEAIIFIQNITASLAVAFILLQFRLLGVRRILVFGCAVLFAVLPQNPLILTTLTKDALYAIACLFLFGVQLRIVRLGPASLQRNAFALIFLIALALIAITRLNGLLSAITMLMVMHIWLSRYKKPWVALKLSIGFLCIFSAVKVSTSFLDVTGTTSQDLIVAYANHFSAAALRADTPVSGDEAALLEKVMPLTEWKSSYDCRMLDKTRAAISSAHKDDQALKIVMREVESDIMRLALSLIVRNPAAAMERQICITRPLWHIGPTSSENLWDTTAPAWLVGIDPGIPEPYASQLKLRSKLPDLMARLQDFVYKTIIPKQNRGWSWMYWSTAIPLMACLIVVLVRYFFRGDWRPAFVFLPFVIHTAVLLLLLPYPAFRYQYPVFAVAPFMFLFFLVPLPQPERAEVVKP